MNESQVKKSSHKKHKNSNHKTDTTTFFIFINIILDRKGPKDLFVLKKEHISTQQAIDRQ